MELWIVDAKKPGKKQAIFNAHDDVVADTEMLEILTRDGEALDGVAVAPGGDHQLMHRQQSRDGEAADDGGFNVARRRIIERAVDQKRRPDEPGNQDKRLENVLHHFDFLAAEGAAFSPNRQDHSNEEDDADENHHAIEVERRIKKAGDEKSDGAKQENSESIDQTAAHGAAGVRRIQSTVFANGKSGALGAAIGTAPHWWESFQIK